jgi:hypothetical protein
MSSLANEPNWLEIVRSKVPDLDEQPKDEQAPPASCDDASVFCCPHCQAPIGATDGRQLTAGAIIINSPAKLTCMACRQTYDWQPIE